MLANISIVALLAFAVFYPLCFFTQVRHRVRGGFYRFHLGLATVVGGCGMVGLFFLDVPPALRGLAAAWLGCLFAVTAFYWRREGVQEFLAAAPSLVGLAVVVWFHACAVAVDPLVQVASLLGGFIVAATVFCMNLGHWYLNVKAMSMRHLTQAVRFLALLLAIRLIWDLGWLLKEEVLYEGYNVSLWRFMGTTDGILLVVALLAGTLLPLVITAFVLRTLTVRATESATGLLYVAVLLVLMGELAYRYYHVTYQLML